MRLPQVLPYAALILLGEAAIGSVPDIVAVREGGMGLGSALLMAQLAQVAGVAFGAAVAAYVVDRGALHVALLAGALLYYAGLIGVGHQPSHLLGWVVAVLIVAGAGLGMILTAAFSVAAGSRPRERPLAIGVLLLAALAAGPLVGNAVFAPGPPTLVVVAALVVAGAVLVAWYARGRSVAQPSTIGGDVASGTFTVRVALAGAGLLAIGVLATLWGIDPSRVSAAIVAGTLGVAGLESLDGLRLGLVLLGLVTVAAGIVLLWVRGRPSPSTVLAAAATAAAALAVAGLLALAGFAMPRDLSPPDSRGGPLGELTAVAGGAAGLAVGAWLLARGIPARSVALAGSVVVAVLLVLVVVDVGSLLGSSGAAGPILAVALTAFGGALTAVALRLLLAEVPNGERGFAAAAGVLAASVGAIVGLMFGAAEGVARATGTAIDTSVGAVVLVVAALAALGLAAVLPPPPPADEARQPEGVEAA